MSVLPIQVTNDGVLIPRVYLDTAGEFELVVTDDYVLVRAKVSSSPSVSDLEPVETRFDFIGIGHTRDPQASINAEEILEREIKRDSGWSLD